MSTVIVSNGFYARHDGLISFEGTAPHGKGKREFSMIVDLETLEAIVDAVREVPDSSIGHALWHLKNDKPFPCGSCEVVRTDDVAGDDAEELEIFGALEPRVVT